MSALVLAGRIVSTAAEAVAPPGSRGRVWIVPEGLAAGVTLSDTPGPAGFGGAPSVEGGDSLVFPGLVDLHSHLGYDTRPLWAEPRRTQPCPHHNSWLGASTYASEVTWTAYVLLPAAPQERLVYVETKAIVGGITSVLGSPPKTRRRPRQLVRSIDDETFGSGNTHLVYTSTLTQRPSVLAERAKEMCGGSGFVYQLLGGPAEHRRDAGVKVRSRPRVPAGTSVAIHCNAVNPAEFARWTEPGAIGATRSVPCRRAVAGAAGARLPGHPRARDLHREATARRGTPHPEGRRPQRRRLGVVDVAQQSYRDDPKRTLLVLRARGGTRLPHEVGVSDSGRPFLRTVSNGVPTGNLSTFVEWPKRNGRCAACLEDS